MSRKYIVPMNRQMAVEISHWDFGEGYRFYNIEGDEEVVETFLNGHYYAVLEHNNIFGFFCDGDEAMLDCSYDELPDCIDIGCALRPELTSLGAGPDFLRLIMNFYLQRQPQYFRLSVAAFNERAIKCYRKVGFQIDNTVRLYDGDDVLDFYIMVHKVQS